MHTFVYDINSSSLFILYYTTLDACMCGILMSPLFMKIIMNKSIYVTGFAKTRDNVARTEIHFIA